ncbi:MAG: DUF4184 family protein [Candidatus Nanopelagicales bacterium]|nr:DUF4184 family protein [Candidatus Nanopelagicales bacterium]MDZ4248472.1 DUF4184 family protein [Candidatus Nanopelagicales bacterium]
MPLTFGSHQAVVLPLKMLKPRWFDGTALVIGSMAPDLFFLTHGTAWAGTIRDARVSVGIVFSAGAYCSVVSLMT